MQNLITEHLDIWTAAHKTRSSAGRGSSNKLDLYGIKKLRELILELAVRGKLVPQDTNDEQENNFSEEIERCSFDLPKNWSWCRLGNLTEILDSKRKPISKNERKDGPHPYYGASGVVDFVSDYIFDEPLVLVGEDGAKWNRGDATAFLISGKSWVNNHAHVLRPNRNLIIDQYLAYFLTASDLNEYITGMTVPKLNQARLVSIPIAIPPLPEQHRIVAKVDELMAFCDQLEQTQSDNIAAHAQLVEALLTTLTDSRDHNELQNNWQRIAAHFDTLFTTEHSIDQLKQTILQLAVMGKLVPQNPSDEPASELLKKIAAEKAQLIKEGKIKKEKPLPEITDEEKPFELPSGWEWVRPDEFSIKITDGEHFKPTTSDSGIYFLSAKDVRDDGVALDDPLYVSQDVADKALARCNPEFGDLLIVSRGATVGRMCKVNITDVFCLLGSVILIKPTSQVLSDYLTVALKSPFTFYQLINASGSTAQPAIYLRDLKKIVIAMPSLNEQHRIVTKVDELMALCDTLKTNLQNAQTTQLALADALVEQAVG